MPAKRKAGRRVSGTKPPTPHIRRNRAVWDRVSGWYDRRFEKVLGGRSAAAWGTYRVPERKLRLLGETRGKKILELGCGAARWSVSLARGGARVTGIDLSSEQLARARAVQEKSRVRFPLVRGSAEGLPFRADAFDIVFCDWGAMTFSDPARSLPECARVLRSGGTFVFATASPFRHVALDIAKDRQVARLVRPYFGSYRVDYGRDAALEFHPPYGVWVDLFRRSGFRIERLIETRPEPGQRTPYLSRADSEWSRSWPLESVWQLVKE